MSGFLLDTNVVSMLSPSRAAPSAQFLGWLALMDNEDRVFLSVVTIHEIEKGIAQLQHKGATAKAAKLQNWLTGLVATYKDRIIPVDVSAAALAGRLEAKAISAGGQPGMADATIAGIAQARGIVIVTQNTKDFRLFGVAIATPDQAVHLP